MCLRRCDQRSSRKDRFSTFLREVRHYDSSGFLIPHVLRFLLKRGSTPSRSSFGAVCLRLKSDKHPLGLLVTSKIWKGKRNACACSCPQCIKKEATLQPLKPRSIERSSTVTHSAPQPEKVSSRRVDYGQNSGFSPGGSAAVLTQTHRNPVNTLANTPGYFPGSRRPSVHSLTSG